MNWNYHQKLYLVFCYSDPDPSGVFYLQIFLCHTSFKCFLSYLKIKKDHLVLKTVFSFLLKAYFSGWHFKHHFQCWHLLLMSPSRAGSSHCSSWRIFSSAQLGSWHFSLQLEIENQPKTSWNFDSQFLIIFIIKLFWKCLTYAAK